MKNEVTEKLELFLQNLRCEDMGRETLVHLDSCRMESERLAELEEEYKQTMNGLGNHSRDFLDDQFSHFFLCKPTLNTLFLYQFA